MPKPEQEIEDLKVRLFEARTQLNESIKKLAKHGIEVDISIRENDDTKTETELFPGEEKLVGFPRKIPGVKCKQVVIKHF